jgi:hypothetical protein
VRYTEIDGYGIRSLDEKVAGPLWMSRPAASAPVTWPRPASGAKEVKTLWN